MWIFYLGNLNNLFIIQHLHTNKPYLAIAWNNWGNNMKSLKDFTKSLSGTVVSQIPWKIQGFNEIPGFKIIL
jgi:hypothetical protein